MGEALRSSRCSCIQSVGRSDNQSLNPVLPSLCGVEDTQKSRTEVSTQATTCLVPNLCILDIYIFEMTKLSV